MKHGPNTSEYPVALAPVGLEPVALNGPVIDIRGLVSNLWRGKWIIVICTLIATAIAYVIVSQFQPQYWASSKVMFGQQRAKVINLQNVLAESEFDVEALQNELEVLRSFSLATRVIDTMELDKNADFNPALRDTGMSLSKYLLSLVPFDLKELGLISDPAPLPEEERARIDRLALIDQFQSSLYLTPVGRSRVIEISFVSTNAQLSADVVNMVAEQYIFDQLEAKLRTARSATQWLGERVIDLRERLALSENTVEEARARLASSSGQGVQITLQQIQAVTSQLSEASKRAAALEAQYNRIVLAEQEGADLGSVPEFRASQILQNYLSQENELLAQQKSLQNTLREGHPALVRIAAQIAEIQSNKAAENARIIASIKISLDAAKTEEAGLSEELRALETLSLEQSQGLLELRQLEREAEANRLLYENFLNRQGEVSVQEDLDEASVRVLSAAFKPALPAGQRKKAIMIIAAVLGAIGGAVIVLMLDMLNNTFRASGQVETQTRLPVLGTVPAVGTRIGTNEVMRRFLKKQNSSLAEAVRNLRTSVLFSNIDTPPKVLMVTSSTPKEGKSTTSLLLAITSAQMGKKTVLVDCDLRRPAIARAFNMQDDTAPGLLSIIKGSVVLEDAVHTDHTTGLDVLMNKNSEAPETINPADILASKRFHDLIKILTREYDMVILDTPPTLVVTDARVVSAVADAVMYVVRWDKTPRSAVLDGMQELKSVGAPLIGTVLTMINESKAAKYIYEGEQYYRGKHREYYQN
jgi:capsular exopolysaccharide synthesis family protein